LRGLENEALGNYSPHFFVLPIAVGIPVETEKNISYLKNPI